MLVTYVPKRTATRINLDSWLVTMLKMIQRINFRVLFAYTPVSWVAGVWHVRNRVYIEQRQIAGAGLIKRPELIDRAERSSRSVPGASHGNWDAAQPCHLCWHVSR